jgi:hypothetical protein
LIICPLSVLSNWEIQFEDHTAGNLQVGPALLSTSVSPGQSCFPLLIAHSP